MIQDSSEWVGVVEIFNREVTIPVLTGTWSNSVDGLFLSFAVDILNGCKGSVARKELGYSHPKL